MRLPTLIAALIAVATLAVLLWPGRDAVSGKITVNFTVWGMPFEDRLFRDGYAVGWERLNPAIRVNYQRYGDDLLMKYNAWQTRGRGSEVMRLRITDYHGMVARGMLEPLGDYISGPAGLGPEQIKALPPHLMAALAVDGEVYALPEDNAQFGMFINLGIVEAYNRDHPGDPVQLPILRDDGTWQEWTWDDLRSAARKLTRCDDTGRVTQAGLDFTVWSWPFMTFLAQAGGSLWSADGLTCTLDSDAGVAALEFFRTLQRDDRSFVPNLAGFQSGTGPDVLFAAGKTGVFLDGSWRVPNIEQVSPTLRFTVAPLPRGKVPAVVSGCVCWGISTKAREKPEGWRMLRWLIEEPQALTYWDTLRVSPPANLAAINSAAFRQTSGILKDPESPSRGYEVLPMPPGLFRDRAAWLLYANTPHPQTGGPPGFVPVGPYQTELEEEIQRMLNEYLNAGSKATAHEVLGRVVRNTHALIDRDRAARGLPPAPRE